MKVNKEELKKLASKPDSELWREINSIAAKHGYKLPDETPKKEDLEKIRRALLGVEKISLTDAARIMNNYKKQQ